MKKTLCAAVLVSMLPIGSAMADKDVGCGAGTLIMKGQKGLVFKVLAATTNGSFGNQTFGITTGTLGCSQDGVVTASERTQMFASANLDQLAAEMAAGNGETMTTLASLYNVSDADRATFNAALQSHYGDVFARADVTTAQVLASIDTVLAHDARLSHYVA
jgi:hypothetical protein